MTWSKTEAEKKVGRVRTIEEAEERYGHIDFASKYWLGQQDWIVMFVVPEGWFPNWKVLDTDQTVKRIACNRDVAVPLRAVMNEIKFHGIGEELKTFDGCFNIRAVRGSNRPSTHAYGLGFDFNATLEPLGAISTHFTPTFIECFKKHGFTWGGDFKGRKDNMHFSYAWE